MKQASSLTATIMLALSLCLIYITTIAATTPLQQPLLLRFDQPAKPDQWASHALPLGNGRLGCMLFGNPLQERIQFNVDSLWTGDENPSGNYDSMGAYQNFGELLLTLNTPEKTDPTSFHHHLDLATAIHTTQYSIGNTRFHRETFVSAPHHAIIIRLTASTSDALSGSLTLKGAHNETTRSDSQDITFDGELPNSLRYAARTRIINQGGSLSSANGICTFEKCNSLTIILTAATSYMADQRRNWQGPNPSNTTLIQLKNAAKTNYDKLKHDHTSDVARFMGRLQLNLGSSTPEQRLQPLPQRISSYAQGAADPELEMLLFQYGRYLLQASSRPGTLPANLQGIWNNSNTPPWHSDYHSNINIQMNYWLAEPANLPECHTAFFDLILSQIPAWRHATAADPEFKKDGTATKGWAIRTSHNIHGGMGWKWDKTANAWYAQHFWEHYAFSGNKVWLRRTAFPLMHELSLFWLSQLKTLPDGRLVVPNAWSPEHGPEEDGVSYSQQIVWDLFNNTVKAARILGAETAFANKLAEARDKLAAPQIGKWGQLQEWMTDRDDPNSQHRHTSHLFAIYPGSQISLQQTPDLAKAAATSLKARGQTGDSRRSWTWPWRGALWARLGEPENCHQMVRGLLTYNMMPNLFTTHPPFQIDGNLGITAAICEMLLQSHSSEIVPLPALPAAWHTGTVTGLRARGGVEVDMTWEQGKLTTLTLRTPRNTSCKLRYHTHQATHQLYANRPLKLDSQLQAIR